MSRTMATSYRNPIVGVLCVGSAIALAVMASKSGLQQSHLVYTYCFALFFFLSGVLLIAPRTLNVFEETTRLLLPILKVLPWRGDEHDDEHDPGPVGPGQKELEETVTATGSIVIPAQTDTGLCRSLYENYPAVYRLTPKTFLFLDWNSVFDLIFGHIDRLKPGEHVSTWARKLTNFQESLRHAEEKFRGASGPDMDVESITYRSPQFGNMRFTKVAMPAVDTHTGKFLGWNCVLNIDYVEKSDLYYAELEKILKRQVKWSSYAAAYDAVVPHFEGYTELVNRFLQVLAANNCNRVLDLGAGTGILSERLIEAGRKVHAIDNNETMLARLRERCGANGNLKISKMDIRRLSRLTNSYYDAIVAMNVLFCLDENELRQCLRDIFALLVPDGLLALSVPREGGNIDELFGAIRSSLKAKGLWDPPDDEEHDLRPAWETLYKHNRQMRQEHELREFSSDRLRRLLTDAGFRDIQITNGDVYAGQGLFATARRSSAV